MCTELCSFFRICRVLGDLRRVFRADDGLGQIARVKTLLSCRHADQSDKQKTAYEMYICDWSSDVCSSDLFFFRKDSEK